MAQEPNSPAPKKPAAILPREIASDILKSHPGPAPIPAAQHQTSIEVTEHMFHGPLPHPQILEGYNRAAPDGAHRVISMAEKEQSHRHGLENRLVTMQQMAVASGQASALLMGLAALGCGTYLMAIGRTLEGFVILVAEVGTLVGVFLYQARKAPEPSKPSTKPDNKPRARP